ncbi:ribose-5-phosphate isomerase RpiA [Archaeoglobus fulgidus]|uniref:Ribose-5-phosphate isomerase A n=2 Tax=Archaeoglobus fulgidus TaxID=2234 RepID=RPIA_ARCFU|nr:ribose-5-phosphate isomerase RpiA [Archaeoglobus fulgidus]O29319.1 RecName: Full=Ribose-5-phosphate isomerase A; AltName: Full=Phosphoriboisomerase A; Short=PRI [Archaeoglobus fulgidus DSM 4304]AAB90297.1 ribose 5-phosphate isomerase (rpi) [Archaeoglobus fulgidus DSM 4304]
MDSSGKYNAAKLALELVKDGMVLGIGSGSTVEVFLNLLGDKIREEGLEIYGIPSSYQSYFAAIRNGVEIVDLVEFEPDLCIDGADQVDAKLNCIKGGGGAMTREKIVAKASRKVVIIVDESKLVEKLSMPVPVEVLPFAYGWVLREIEKMGCKARLREGKGKIGPVITDNGNFVVDCDFGVIEEDRVEGLEGEIKLISGVVENGIFSKELIDAVIAGSSRSARFL